MPTESDFETGKTVPKDEESDDKPMTGGASADDVMDAERENTDAKLTGLAGAPPTPTEPIPAQKQMMLIKAIDAVMQFLTDGQTPKFSANMDVAAGATQAPMEQIAWDSLFAISKLVEGIAHVMPDVASTYTFNPQDVVTGKGVSDITGKLQQLSRDKKFKAETMKMLEEAKSQMQADSGAPPEQTGMGAPPSPTTM